MGWLLCNGNPRLVGRMGSGHLPFPSGCSSPDHKQSIDRVGWSVWMINIQSRAGAQNAHY